MTYFLPFSLKGGWGINRDHLLIKDYPPTKIEAFRGMVWEADTTFDPNRNRENQDHVLGKD